MMGAPEELEQLLKKPQRKMGWKSFVMILWN